MKINFDVDIDMADRDKFLKLVDVIPASIKRDGEFEKHNTGVYFQPIPNFPIPLSASSLVPLPNCKLVFKSFSFIPLPSSKTTICDICF